ncbi:PREDICTED: probable WRKY transcription factor 65 [Ipomoea nil]|uniref:probable WRKY transcription factor 65 n=1 Tax=Ipomoea nil TaxID=35883 RepID=UPI0009017758|nr:PREDICTED: probable WRKY transcription factor 65 [Ipomoea nil]
MDGRFSHQPPFANDQDDSENSPENSADSPRSGMFHDTKMASINSPKRSSSRRAIQKRVVSVPISDVEGSKLKGEISFPPSDSWAWRKYGQKPIKGSPYPRGYYRCSSSKGCPAKKQVERSRVDPNMLVVTYSCEHNHPWPAARNNHVHRNAVTLTAAAAAPTTRSSSKATTSSKAAAAAVSDSEDGREAEASDFSAQPEPETSDKFAGLGDSSSVIYSDEFGWFSSFEPTTSTVIESTSILTEARVTHADMSVIFSMREEEGEESPFAGLGELPECSREFGIGMMERDEARRRHNLTPWCGTA